MNKVFFLPLLFVYLSIEALYCSHDLYFLTLLKQCIDLPSHYFIPLDAIATQTSEKVTDRSHLFSAHNCLFDLFPTLQMKIPYINFADLPTPIQKLDKFGQFISVENLYIKRDDLTGCMQNGERVFGGNKVRKLEFLLADAQINDAKSVVTFGCVGSNHAVAIAAYAQKFITHASL